jgi:hypothetical protein
MMMIMLIIITTRADSELASRGQCLNNLKTAFLMIDVYKHSVCTTQETHHVSATEPNRLMLFGERVAVRYESRTVHTGTLFGETVALCCENRTVHTGTLCGQCVPSSKHIPSPLMLFGEQSLFAVRTVRYTQVHCVGRKRNSSVLK